ncbi:MAG TPA: helix-hairpin-helix domain-containing protein [Myxococcaceae bacterium]|nr:helix-hairpin-helix domain-containing protein [Myxococcaceae bacterium]
MDRPTNAEVAAALERVSELLQAQGANPYRLEAYRAAGAAVRRSERPLGEVLAERGPAGLQETLSLGPALASVIRELVLTGRLTMLDRLEGEVAPEDLFMTVPGMGEALARRAHTMLRLETLEDLETAAREGRLEKLPGFGPRRALLVREAVGQRLAGSRRCWSGAPDRSPPPPVELLLAIDGEYRRRAAAGELKTIRPRRFNPSHEAWLPIWHTERDGWAFTALLSSTDRPCDPRMINDPVVVFFERDGCEGQATVVTATRGLLAGLRVVRGREAQSQAHYDAVHRAAEPPHGAPSGPSAPPLGGQEALAI